MKTSYIALDLETTGLDPQKDQILEIGAVKIQDGKETERYETFVRVGIPIPEKIQELTGITEEMAASGIPMEEAVRGLLDFCGKEDILGHNILFDYSFVKCHAARIGENFEKRHGYFKDCKKVSAGAKKQKPGVPVQLLWHCSGEEA